MWIFNGSSWAPNFTTFSRIYVHLTNPFSKFRDIAYIILTERQSFIRITAKIIENIKEKGSNYFEIDDIGIY
jgi:hypothetical protein